MRASLRTLTALLALVAFSAVFAEQVRASICMPAGAASTQQHPGHHDPAPGHEPAAPAPSGDDCPLHVVVAGCSVISAPAVTPSVAAPEPRPHGGVPGFDDSPPHDLLAASFFRPPRA